MVRRRKRGSNAPKLIAVLLVVIGIGTVVAIMTTPVGEILVIAGADAQQTVNGWVTDASFSFAVVTNPNSGIECFVSNTLFFNFESGRRVLVQRDIVQVPIVTIFSVADLGNDPIANLRATTTLVCDPVGNLVFSSEIVGGSISYIWTTVNEAGQTVLIDREDKFIPSIARRLEGGVMMPSSTILDTEIESAVNLQNVASKIVSITVVTDMNFLIKTSVTGDLLNSGQISSQSGGTVKVIDDTVTPPPPTVGTNVDLTQIIPSQHNYVGDATPVNSNQIGEGGHIKITVIGNLDNYQTSEGLPFVNVRAPAGQVLSTNNRMSAIGTSGGVTTFSTGAFEITNLFVRDTNIDNFKGAWTVEMHSNNDVRGNIDSMTFALADARNVAPPTPPVVCDSAQNLEPDGMGGCKMIDTPTIPTITCPSISTMGLFISSATEQELLDKKTELDGLKAQGNIQQCVSNYLQLVNAEIAVRGISTEDPDPTGLTSSQAFIEYLSNYAPKESEQSGCTIPTSGTVGRLPTQGLDVIGFQLIGMGAPCSGNTWGSTDMTIVIDFGDQVKDFVPDKLQIDTEARMIISVNNPFPSDPNFSCSAGSTTSIPTTCGFTNHNFLADKIGSVGVTGSEYVETGVFVDQQAGDPRYAIATVKLQNNGIKDKIQKNHILLDGDKVEVMFYTWGKFGGTFKGNPVTGAYLPLWYVEKFTWDNTGVQIKCPDGENLREDRTCKPDGSDICELPNKRDVNDVCRAPPTNGGTNGGTTNGGLVCEASLPVNQPVCTAEQSEVPTGLTDACDIPFYECKAKDDPTVIDKPEPSNCIAPQISDGMGGCIDKPADSVPKVDDACPAMYLPDPDDSTKCKLIGSDLEGDDGVDGGGGDTSTCAGGNIGACFAELIQKLQQGLPSFTFGTGIDPLIFVGIAIAVIALVAVGIIIRRRSGGVKF